MKQSAPLEFESTAFAVLPGEDEQTNPGVYGKALAQWLAEQLRARGFPSGDIIAEDFGWCVPVESKPHHLYVACGSVEGEPNHWRVFAFVEGGLLSRVLGHDKSTELLASLFAAVKQALEATPAIKGLREEET
jgi:hypothetical protein